MALSRKPKRKPKPKVVVEPLQQCFPIMSFSEEAIENAFSKGTKKAVSALGFTCERVDQPSLNKITDEIEDLIRRSYFVIADLTKKSPNCFYELGFAHGLGKPVVLIARRRTKLPFDVNHYPVIFYESEKDLSSELSRWIRGAVLKTRARDPNEDPQNGRFGRLAVRNGRLLMARVLRQCTNADGDPACDIRVEVRPLPGRQQLKGPVRFFVHPAYGKSPCFGKKDRGCATIELKGVVGAFTVGAKTDAGHTMLELDLAMIPGAPFYRARSLRVRT